MAPPLGRAQGISKYYTTQVPPSRVETLRKTAKLPKLELVPKFRDNCLSCLKQNSGPEWVFVGISVCVPYLLEFSDQFLLKQFCDFTEGFDTGWRPPGQD